MTAKIQFYHTSVQWARTAFSDPMSYFDKYYDCVLRPENQVLTYFIQQIEMVTENSKAKPWSAPTALRCAIAPLG